MKKGVREIRTPKYFAPAIPDVPEKGEISLPNGCTLFWRDTEQGREYLSDEIGGGVQVWHTALVDEGTLLAAIVQEQTLQRREREIDKRIDSDRSHYGPLNPAPGCVRYVGEPPVKVEDVTCSCWHCNDYGDFS